MCGTPAPRCKDCGIILTAANAYGKQRSSTGFQSRCKKCQIEYQKGLRERKKAGKGASLVEVKVSGRDGAVKLHYNPRRQVVDVYGPLTAKDAGAFWVNAFDCDKGRYTYKEGKRTFHVRLIHISRDTWEEVTIDLETVQKVEEEAEELRDYDVE